jgi:tRNA threonylcarbamoyladenosine biosynthesis protein TsaB
MYLFLDTTKDMTIGLLDESLTWLDYHYYPDAKSSATIHLHIHNILKKQNKEISDVKALFQLAGPGSYTGMRVSEGISQIFQWQNITTYSFYHFNIPAILGHNSGTWINNAFKGELFIYHWDTDGSKVELVAVSELHNVVLKNKVLYTSFANEMFPEAILTKNLIFDNSPQLFNYLIKNTIRNPIYYYRSIEEEYRRQDL